MLEGISPLFSPELLAALYAMGHGDELVLADAHFPGESLGQEVIRADGLKIPDLLRAILPLYAIDTHDEHPLIMMAPVEADRVDPNVESSYRAIIGELRPGTPTIHKLERFDFYERAQEAFVVVQTGDTATYANIIIRKGVTPLRSF